MPAEDYYWDNFFQKMTDLESPKKNNDCYFYYYSTCAKGDSCTFRHEPSALGCETMCSFWKEGKCLNVHCNFRHMELRKNRKAIPCYWESQPVGCLKTHCPFLHQNPRPADELSMENSNSPLEKSNSDSETNERKVTAVESLVVNFEEESDNESVPSNSPLKSTNRIVRVKTLEEIRLEKIQAESAAYYSFSGEYSDLHINENGEDMRQRIVRRIVSKKSSPKRALAFTTSPSEKSKSRKRLTDDQMANILGDESLRKKRKIVDQMDDGNVQITLDKSVPEIKTATIPNEESQGPNLKKDISHKKNDPAVQDIKIKTLAEIRAERDARNKVSSENMEQKMSAPQEQGEAEVSSTSFDETVQISDFKHGIKSEVSKGPKRKIKLRRKLTLLKEENDVSSNNGDEKMVTSAEENVPSPESAGESFSSDKMDEDILLLEDEEDCENVTLKADDELLNEIDSIIDN